MVLICPKLHTDTDWQEHYNQSFLYDTHSSDQDADITQCSSSDRAHAVFVWMRVCVCVVCVLRYPLTSPLIEKAAAQTEESPAGPGMLQQDEASIKEVNRDETL